MWERNCYTNAPERLSLTEDSTPHLYPIIMTRRKLNELTLGIIVKAGLYQTKTGYV